MTTAKLYYNGSNIDFQFIKLPRFLFVHPKFQALKLDAKVLYSHMLNFMSLSYRRGNVLDGKPYLKWSIDYVMELMQCCRATAVRLLKNLKEYGRIETLKAQRGRGSLYVIPDFSCYLEEKVQKSAQDTAAEPSENQTDSILNSLQNKPEQSKMQTGNGSLFEPEAVQKTDAKKKNNKKTVLQKDLLQKEAPFGTQWRRQEKQELIQELECCWDREFLCSCIAPSQVEKLIELTASALSCGRKTFMINQQSIPAWEVTDQLLNLTPSEIEYALSFFEHHADRQNCPAGYYIAVLYNAPMNAEAYMDAWVARDMREGISSQTGGWYT